MPRKSRTTPSGERRRDERREGGPRMQGHQWADYETPRELDPEILAAPDAVPEVESSGDREGMSTAIPRRTKGRGQQDLASPRGKGPKRRASKRSSKT